MAYEVFDGDTADVTTLEEIVDKIENKYRMRDRVWVFDRGIVSEDNLQDLRQRGAFYLVGTPRRKLANFERELLEGDWQEIAGKSPGCASSFLKKAGRPSSWRAACSGPKKESAMLRSQLVRPEPWRAFAPSSWWKSGSACVTAAISACRHHESEKQQALLLHHLGWDLPEQPPPRVYSHQIQTHCVAD